ncbi:MAG: aminotransferase class I/II-fold pyridoxal phosphate-dependent enzyme [Firmicutes bacterium]|nr:aminotransferase class I/II-fold pyridoxal phosphate-dependent enzyme [Bacillota bacterium]
MTDENKTTELNGGEANSKTSLDGEIKKLVSLKMFCTPGHKGTLKKDDITEIDGVFPLDFVERAQRETAKYFKAEHLRYLTNGSSIGIKAALLGTGDILANAGCHPSIAQAAQLSGAKIYYIDADIRDGLTLPPTKKQVETALGRFPDTGVVVLTAPDYYGLMPDAGAAKAVKKAGLRLLIDGAHATHAFFRPDLFDTSIFKYADMFNLSAHKTLGAYTQTAYLCVSDAEIKRVDRNLKLLGTTSPYYPFMARLQAAADEAYNNRAVYDDLYKAVKAFKKRINCLKNDDFTRIVVDCKDVGDTKAIYRRLLQNGIAAEKYDERHIVFIVTLCDKAEDVDRLAEELGR